VPREYAQNRRTAKRLNREAMSLGGDTSNSDKEYNECGWGWMMQRVTWGDEDKGQWAGTRRAEEQTSVGVHEAGGEPRKEPGGVYR
jgi:hypothetical protein